MGQRRWQENETLAVGTYFFLWRFSPEAILFFTAAEVSEGSDVPRLREREITYEEIGLGAEYVVGSGTDYSYFTQTCEYLEYLNLVDFESAILGG